MHFVRGLFVLPFALAAMPQAAQDPWSRVPAFPTACYTDDGFTDRVSNVRHEVVVAADEQENINTEIRQQSINLDPMAKQQKMMAFLQKNPTQAGQMMQDIAMSPQKAQQAIDRLGTRKQALDDQLKTAEDQYKAETAALRDIRKKYNEAMPNPPSPGNPALLKQYGDQYNAAWERTCTTWLKSPTSPFLKYLGDYRTYLIEEKVAAENEKAQWEKKEFDLYGIPHSKYKPAGAEKAVVEYLDQVLKIFERRESSPLTGRP